MYFWYYYLESDLGFDESYDESVFISGFAESEDDMISDMASLSFENSKSVFNINLEKFKYITQHDLVTKTLQPLQMYQSQRVRNKIQEMLREFQKKEKLINRREQIKRIVNSTLSVNPLLKKEDVKEFFNISDEDWNLYLGVNKIDY
jgi:hypothetical protein